MFPQVHQLESRRAITEGKVTSEYFGLLPARRGVRFVELRSSLRLCGRLSRGGNDFYTGFHLQLLAAKIQNCFLTGE